jgi:hypothetical protein
VQQLFDQVDVCQDHAAAAISLESKGVKGITGKTKMQRKPTNMVKA